MLEAVGRLPKLCREAFVLHHIEQESYETIAEQMQNSPHQVRALCHKAITRLRKLMVIAQMRSEDREAPRAES